MIQIRLGQISDATALSNPTTPQRQAQDWIIGKDPAEINQCSPQLYQRYAMAALYFGLGGDEWNNNRSWLSGDSVCLWFGVTTKKCVDSNLKVTELSLGTCFFEHIMRFDPL
jgi:hypothetical protein